MRFPDPARAGPIRRPVLGLSRNAVDSPESAERARQWARPPDVPGLSPRKSLR